jgi:hypothetical protein
VSTYITSTTKQKANREWKKLNERRRRRDVGAQHGQLDKASTMQAKSREEADRALKETELEQTKLKPSKRGHQIGQQGPGTSCLNFVGAVGRINTQLSRVRHFNVQVDALPHGK